jgi:hypothetical protein
MMEHTRYICKCYRVGCQFCDGGLFSCTVCGCLEGSLPTECPGVDVWREKGEAIYAGEIDFRNGQWVEGPSVCSPAYYRKWQQAV